MLAPIIIFAYNRLIHLEKTVEALKNNELADESDLFIFSDGSKIENDESVKKVREYIKTIDGFKSVTIIEREKNLGLANSIISGVTEIVNKFGKVIVLEDDLVTSKYFLRFMNDGLNFYENEEKVISIHGYMYDVKKDLPETFFLKGADCLGWATWKRGWQLFNPDGKKLLEDIMAGNLQNDLDMNGRSQFTRMLSDQVAGRNNSWAVRWHVSAFLNGKITLWSSKSLVFHYWENGKKGTNCGATPFLDTELSDRTINVESIPLTDNIEALKAILDLLEKKKGFFFFRKLRLFIKKMLRELK